MNNLINKNKILLGIGTLMVVGISVGGYLIYNNNKGNEVKVDDTNEAINLSYEIAKEILSGKGDGKIELRDIENKNIIQELDLKELLSKPIPKKIVLPVVEDKRVTNEIKKDVFEGFEKISVEFKEGDTTWWIQKDLTPDEDTWSMVELLRQVNGGENLDYVLPGESRTFLKKINEDTMEITNTPEESNEDIIKEEVVVDTTESIKEELDLSDVSFIYSKSLDFQTLYAYTPFDNSIFKINIVNSEIQAEKIAIVNNINEEIEDFKVEDDIVYLKTLNNIYILQEDNSFDKVSLEGMVSDWTVFDGDIFYTSSENLIKVSKDKLEKNYIELGEESENLEIVNSDIYVLNKFGTKNYKSVVQKINPKDLSSYGWKELNTNENTMYDMAIDNSSVIIAQHRVENTKDSNYLINIDLEKIKKSKESKLKQIFTNALVKENIIYNRSENKLELFTSEKLEKVAELDIDGDIFIPIMN